VDASERLAALLAGELDADERIALEAELARDPELRADLRAMERADARLAELRSPEPTAGFEQRLDERMTATLAEVLGDTEDEPGTAGSSAAAAGDPFTARRRERTSRRMQALIGVAAATVVLAGGGVLVSSLGSLGGDDAAEMADDSAMSDSAGSAESESDASDEALESQALESQALVLDGPVVVAEDRTLDDDDLDELLAGGELEVVASQQYDGDLGRELAGRFQSDLGVRAPQGDAAADQERDDSGDDDGDDDGDDGGEGDGAAQEESTEDGDTAVSSVPELFTREGSPLEPAAAEAVARCLEEVLSAEPGAIAAYAELATYQDAEAIVLGLVTLDPETDAFTRSELWVLDRSTCQLLRFVQG
jgi:hypothetical protein